MQKKKAVAAAAAAAEKEAAAEKKKKLDNHIYHTVGGTRYMSLDVAGGGMCGLLALIALYQIIIGILYAEVFAAVKGRLTDEMKEHVQWLRGTIVNMSDGRSPLADGEESGPFEDVVDNPNHEIETKGMWEKVTLGPHGYLGGFAMGLLAEFFELDGFRIVRREREDEPMVSCNAKDPTLNEKNVHLVLYDGYGHFKALVLMESIPVSSELS